MAYVDFIYWKVYILVYSIRAKEIIFDQANFTSYNSITHTGTTMPHQPR